MAAAEDLRAGADVQRLTAAIHANDLPGAIAALNLDPAAFNDLLEALREAYLAGGQGAVQTMRAPATVGIIRFDGRNVAAERWLQDHSSELVTRILTDQREAIRVKLSEGMADGANPRSTALEIVGRLNRASGKREGGLLGLTAQQAGYVASARQELSSGDPEALQHYLTRGRRDKRFDRSVLKAIREEKPLPADIARKAVAQYESRLLQLRGEMIARSETLRSLQAAKHQAYLQAVESGKLSATAVRRVWRDVGDLRVRHTHRLLDGDTVGLNEAFRSPSGALMMFPGDTSLGAPASETVGCRCDVNYRIDFLANLT